MPIWSCSNPKMAAGMQHEGILFQEKPREKICWCPGAIQSLTLKSLIVEFV